MELKRYQEPSKKTIYGSSTYAFTELMKDIKSIVSGFGEFTTLTAQVAPLISCVTDCQKCNSPYKFYEIYDKTPNLLVSKLHSFLASCPQPPSGTVEEMLKYYMNLSQSANNLAFLAVDSIPGILHVLDLLGKYFHWNGMLEDCSCSYSLALKPVYLAILWGLMLTNLSRYVVSYTSDADLKDISRLSLALTIGAISGLTGYFHAGGYAGGIKSPTSCLVTYFNVQYLIKDHFPNLYVKIPDSLKIPAPKSFSEMTSYESISASKGMNMAYTFRVGDSFLTTVEGRNNSIGRYLKEVMKKLWPLVTDSEANKMYNLYVLNEKLYYL